MNNHPYTYYPPTYQPLNQNRRETQQVPSSKTIVHHEPIHVGNIPSQPINLGNIPSQPINPEINEFGFYPHPDEVDTRQFGFGRRRRPGYGRPGFGRPGFGGGFFGPFLLGSLAGATITRPYYPYPYYPYYPYPYY